MDNKNEQILSQYDLTIINTYKNRGTVILECEDGLKLMKSYEYSERKAVSENTLKLALYNNGYCNTDIFQKNNDNKYISLNRYGNAFVIKKWFEGEECNLCDMNNVVRASANLAILHNKLNTIELNEEEYQGLSVKNILSEFVNYNQEMKRVKKYILNKKKKNQLEIDFLNNIDYYYEQGLNTEKMLNEINYSNVHNNIVKKKEIFHGSYNYHNILINRDEIATVSFNYAGIGTQVYDLYCFIRKTLEKNEWNIEFADKIIEEYSKIKTITPVELKILYILLYYPEKFRKIINNYYNSQKIWMSSRLVSKLSSVIENEKGRNTFIEYMKKNI